MEFQSMALRCFREAAQRKSIRKAAEVMGLSPSSVHRQVIKLEAQVGGALFERSSDGVRLTAAGEVFYRYAQRARHDLDRVVSEIDDLRGVRRGHVRVACEEGLGKDFLPQVLTPFRRKYAGVSFAVRIMDMPGIVAGVAEGEYDAGIAFNPQTHAGIKRQAQVPVAVGAVLLPGHPLAKRKLLRLADLVGEALIVADSGFTIRRMLDVQAGSSREHLQIVAETNSFEAITALVKSGAGVAIRTRTGIAEEIARGEVVFVPIAERGFHMETIAVITKAKWTLPVAAAIFVEQLAAALPRLGDAPPAARVAGRKSG